MPYNSFKIVRDIVHKLRMGDVNDANDTPEIIITEQNQNTTIGLQKPSGQDGSITTTKRCNGYSGYSISDHPPSDHTALPASATTRHGSNGSAHFIRRDDRDHEKPLDTTVNFTYDPTKDTEKKEETPSPTSSVHRITRCPRLSLRASFNHRDKKKKCVNVTKKFVASPFGVLCLILVYLSLGACIFMWMERGEESKKRTDLISRRYKLTKSLVNCTAHELDPTECLVKIVTNWEQELVRDFPILYIHLGDDNTTTPKIWNWPNAFYGCFSVITTIGYGTIAPITKYGRLFVVIYAIVGIPLMLLLVADIGGQLARVVKIVVITVRKRRLGKEKSKEDKETKSPPAITVQNEDDRNSPHVKRRRDTIDLKGHVNEGLESDEDFGDNHAREAHLNGVNLHLEVAGHNDSDSSYSSCDNASLGPSPKRRKRRKHFKRDSMQMSNTNTPPHINSGDVSDCGCRQDQSCKECIGSTQGHHGITIQIDCDESSDCNSEGDEKDDSNWQREPTYDTNSQVFHAVNSYECVDDESDHLDRNNKLPASPSTEHQIKNFDSVSQCSNQYHGESTPSITLDVPRFRITLPSSNDDQSSAHDDGIASSIASSTQTTASTSPTCQKRSSLPHDNTVDALPKVRIDEALNYASSASQSPSSSPKMSRISHPHRDRRVSTISQISMNLACLEPRELDIPVKRAVRSRRSAVKFGAALGSFSSVSENDIAVFSIPLWLALLLLFIYLMIGAFCYSAMENWALIDSFYYAFISLSTIGFGDLYFVPGKFEGSLVFNFIYCFIGLSFVSMVWGLSSREFTLLARKIGRKLGYYKSRRWRQSFRGWTNRMRQRSMKRWSSRRRNAVKVPPESSSHNGHASDISSHSSHDEAPPRSTEHDITRYEAST